MEPDFDDDFSALMAVCDSEGLVDPDWDDMHVEGVTVYGDDLS